MKVTLKPLFLSICLLISATAKAGVFVRASGLYLIDTDEVDENTSDETTDTFMDFHLGWMTSKGFGIAYTIATHSEEDIGKTSTATTTTSVEKSSSGVTLGWANPKPNGIFAFATYFLSSEITRGTTNQDTTYSGSGYQVEIGYKATIKRLGFGAHIAYKSLSYDTYTAGTTTTTLTSPLAYSDVVPMIDIWLVFQ